MERILRFFSERSIPVDSVQMQSLLASEARLTILCLIERDRIRHTWYALEKIPGIQELELLESNGASIIKLS